MSLSAFVFGALAFPAAAMARDAEPAAPMSRSDPKHRQMVVRPRTESALIRKVEKLRIRRILM